MLTDIAINLLAAFLGFLISHAYTYLRQVHSRRAARWLWAPVPSSKIYLYYGEWKDLLSDLGELESVINVQDALTLGELRMFLKPFYTDVVVTTDRSAINWQFPVVSLGGPLPNPLTKEIGEQGWLPIWFLDMPYSQSSERAIGSSGRAEVFKSEFNESDQLVSDVGFVARLRSPENPQQFLYVIAGNYGIGSLGVVRYLSSGEKLAQLRSRSRDRCFQAIIRSRVLEGNITNTNLVHYRGLD